MICPYCQNDQSVVYNTRQFGDVRLRSYKCGACGRKFKTKEIHIPFGETPTKAAKSELVEAIATMEEAARLVQAYMTSTATPKPTKE